MWRSYVNFVALEKSMLMGADGGELSKWYAVSTYPRHEKKAFTFLQTQDVTTYLPTYRKTSKWRNGVTANIELPLISGYLFVRIAWQDRLRVLQSPGIAQFVMFGGFPAEIPEFEIERLRTGFVGLRPEPHPYLNLGDMVLIKSGPLAGMQGIVISKRSGTRVAIAIELLMRAISVEVDPANLEHVVTPQRTIVVAGEHGRSMTSSAYL